MPLQARAEATRRRILDSAVDLFDELGYGETGLADVLHRAGVSKGAFYYHFDSKEAVATAIIEDYRQGVKDSVSDKLDVSTPLLDRLIVATFMAAEMLETDKSARIGNQLLQALSQISSAASRIYAEWTAEFTGALTKAFETVGVRDGVDAAEMAEAAWAGILGCHLLSSAFEDDPYGRLMRAWRAVIRVTVPEKLADRYFELLDRSTTLFQKVG